MEDLNLKTLLNLQSYISIKENDNKYSVSMCGRLLADFYDIEPLNIFLETMGMSYDKENKNEKNL